MTGAARGKLERVLGKLGGGGDRLRAVDSGSPEEGLGLVTRERDME